MLALPDVQCVAICDVQASRREAGKKLVDGHYGNSDCVLYRDFRELLGRKDIDAVLIATGDRWHAPASILAAQAGKDVYSEKPCGITIADCQDLADTMKRDRPRLPGRHAAAERPQLPAGRRARPQRQARQAPHAATPRSTRRRSTTRLAARRADARPRRGRLGPLAGPGPVAALQPGLRRRPVARLLRLRLRRRLLDWGAHTVDLCQWANKADDTMPIEYEPSADEHHGPLRQRREAGARLPQDPLRRAARLDQPPGHLPGPVRRRRGLGRDRRQRRDRGLIRRRSRAS